MFKRIIIFTLLTFSNIVKAQNTLQIGNGTKLNTSGSVHMVYTGGNYTNNGTFTDASGNYSFAGTSTYSGTGTKQVYNFNKSSGSSSLNSMVSVLNTATIANGASLNAGSENLYLRSDVSTTANLVNNGSLTGTVKGLTTKASQTTGTSSYTSNLSLNVSGSSMVYQWQSSPDSSQWTNVANANSSSYTATVSSTIYYRCLLTTSNTVYNQSTPGVKLTYVASCSNPTINIQPTTQRVNGGTNAAFSVVASGNTLTYQWQESTNGGFSYTNISNGGLYNGATSASLTISPAKTFMTDYLYRCLVSDASCTTTSNADTLIVDIIISGANCNIYCGNDINGVYKYKRGQTCGSVGKYYYEKTDQSSYICSYSNNVWLIDPSCATTTFTNNYSSGGAPADTGWVSASNCALPITVNGVVNSTSCANPTINTQPIAQSVNSGANATFIVTASGTGLTYQWQESTNGGSSFSNITNGGIYSNATTASLTLTGVTATQNNYQYRCVVSESTCNTTSNAVALTVNTCTNPIINTQPTAQSVNSGANATFTVSASGTGLTYQWQESTNGGISFTNITNGGIYSNATTASLTLTGVTSSQNTYQYRCIISESTCNTTSNAVALTVNTCTNPIINTQPATQSVNSGGNATFTVSASGTGLTYQWQESTNGGTSFTNITNGGIYSNATTASLTLSGVTLNQDNFMYRCVVTEGLCSKISNNAIISVYRSSVTSSHTKNNQNSMIFFGIENTKSHDITLKSIRSAVASSPAKATTAKLTLLYQTTPIVDSSSPWDGGTVGVGQNGWQTAFSDSVTIVANSLDVSIAGIDLIIPAGKTYQFALSANSANPGIGYMSLLNNTQNTFSSCDGVNLLTGGNFGWAGNPIPATPTFYPRGFVGSIYYSDTSTCKTPSLNTQPVASAVKSGGNTTFTVAATGTCLTYQWQVSKNAGTSFSNIANGGIYSNATTSSLTLSGVTTTQNNYLYRCIISNDTCRINSNEVALSVCANPIINTQPTAQSTNSGANATFTVSASGTTLTYQWQESTNGGTSFTDIIDGGVYSGSTTDSLTLTGVTAIHNNLWYRCVVSEGKCSTMSDSAKLTVNSEWVLRNTPADNSWNSVAYGNGVFVALSYNGSANHVMSSSDGVNWILQNTPDNSWMSVAYGKGIFVAVAGSGTGNRVMTSTDGITWTSRASAADNSWNSVTYGNGLFVAVASSGTGNRVMTSPDGINWTSQTSAADKIWTSVGYGNGLFVAVATLSPTDNAMTSPDGITWTSRTLPSNINWRSVAYGNGRFVVVGGANPGQNKVLSSADGITWESKDLSIDNFWSSVTYGDSLFVAVSGNGIGNRVMTSTDGLNWESQVSIADYSWSSVTYGHGLYVAVASTGVGNRVMTWGKYVPPCSDPIIITQPLPQTVNKGESVTFAVDVVGKGLNYQWQESKDNGVSFTDITDGGIYSNATTSSLTLTGVTLNQHHYLYRCNVSMLSCSTTSTYAKLSVNTAPTLTAIQNQTVCVHTITSPIEFTVSDVDTNDIRVMVSSDNATLLPKGSIRFNNNQDTVSTGLPGTRNITVTPATGQSGTATIKLATFDGRVYGDSTTFTFTVIPAPKITVQPKDTVVCPNKDAAFELTAQGDNLKYQWQEQVKTGEYVNVTNGGRYAGATTSKLSISNVDSPLNSMNFRCIVYGTCAPSDTSKPASLIINNPTADIYQTACDAYTWDRTGQTYTNSGRYTVAVPVSGSCDSIITMHLTITPLVAIVTVTENVLSCNIQGAEYSWMYCGLNGDLEPINYQSYERIYTATELGDYAVAVEYNGCKDTSNCYSVNIKSKVILDFATAFSPNGDGINDYFLIKNVQLLETNHLTIMNQFGAIVFETDAYKNNWDGRTQGGSNLPDGTYFYVFTTPDNTKYNGYITLKR